MEHLAGELCYFVGICHSAELSDLLECLYSVPRTVPGTCSRYFGPLCVPGCRAEDHGCPVADRAYRAEAEPGCFQRDNRPRGVRRCRGYPVADRACLEADPADPVEVLEYPVEVLECPAADHVRRAEVP